MSTTYRRWNHERREMEDWWPGKCCGRAYFHNSYSCYNQMNAWESRVPLALPAVSEPAKLGACPRCGAVVDTIYAGTICTSPWHTRGVFHPQPAASDTAPYRHEYPFDSIDRARWPNTWWALFTMYFSGDYWKDTRWVSDKIVGFKPESKDTIVSYDQNFED